MSEAAKKTVREFPKPHHRSLRKSIDSSELVEIDDFDENDQDLDSVDEPDLNMAGAHENM